MEGGCMGRSNKQISNETEYQQKLKELKAASDYRKPFYQTFNPAQPQETGSPSNGSSIPNPDLNDPTDNDIVKLAKAQIGKPYIFSTEGPDTFDCSGLVWWVFNKNGYKFDRLNCKGLWKLCDPIQKPNAGDLVFFANTYTTGLSHVGIMASETEYVQAQSTRTGVIFSKTGGTKFQEHFAGYGRIKDKYRIGGDESKSKSPTISMKSLEPIVATTTKEDVFSSEFTDLTFDNPPDLEEEGYTISTGLPSNPSYRPRTLNGQTLTPVTFTREFFMKERITWARNTKYASFVPLNRKYFIHMADEQGHHSNLYSPDARLIFEELYRQSKWKTMSVISGFRFSPKNQINPHECGCAIDILVKTEKERQFLCDLAWKMGLRSIAYGGNMKKGTGFVHIDIMPGTGFSVDGGPIYRGPGK
jgi:cell wall-associated NlpC family hydrolase